jgi:hypothetical protein
MSRGRSGRASGSTLRVGKSIFCQSGFLSERGRLVIIPAVTVDALAGCVGNANRVAIVGLNIKLLFDVVFS